MQVANYCRDRIHIALAEEIRSTKDDLKDGIRGENKHVQWEKTFNSCFVKVDDEIEGKVSRDNGDGSDVISEPVAPETVGSTAVVALVCSSHIIVANCGDSRAVLCRGKEAMALSVDHKVRHALSLSLLFHIKPPTNLFLHFFQIFCSQIEKMSMQG